MLEHIICNSSDSLEIFKDMVDPASNFIDHKTNPGIGMILCSSSINKIRNNRTFLIPALNVLLEPTIFGVAVSGEIPSFLKHHVEVIQANSIVPRLVKQIVDPDLFVFEDETSLNRTLTLFGDKKCWE